MLGDYNILILDEPGNHLDVDTVDALVDALVSYQGTVIFTSHDRHFTKRVATCIIEVRDGRVVNYTGQYEAYVEKVNSEIEAGERETAAARGKLTGASTAPKGVKIAHSAVRSEKELRKEMKSLERNIAQLDEQKKAVNNRWLSTNDPTESSKLELELETVTADLEAAEEKWASLYEVVEAM